MTNNIIINILEKYNLYHKNEFGFRLIRNKQLKSIYKFAQQMSHRANEQIYLHNINYTLIPQSDLQKYQFGINDGPTCFIYLKSDLYCAHHFKCGSLNENNNSIQFILAIYEIINVFYEEYKKEFSKCINLPKDLRSICCAYL